MTNNDAIVCHFTCANIRACGIFCMLRYMTAWCQFYRIFVRGFYAFVVPGPVAAVHCACAHVTAWRGGILIDSLRCRRSMPAFLPLHIMPFPPFSAITFACLYDSHLLLPSMAFCGLRRAGAARARVWFEQYVHCVA